MRADIPGRGPIEFEGRVLPEGAKYFECAPFYGSLPAEIRQWGLDLRYAWARVRSAPSRLVLQACDEIEHRIHSERAALFEHLRRRFPEARPDQLWFEWLEALSTMQECAERCSTCEWTIRPLPGEVQHYLGVTMRLARTLIETHRSEFSADQLRPLSGVLGVIESRPETEQIAFINSVVDSVSDERQP